MDLQECFQNRARLFDVSSRLQSVATGMRKMAFRQSFNLAETINFPWVGDLIGQLDWNSDHYNKEHPELTITATSLRPKFYSAIKNLKIRFDARFSECLYQALKSYGEINFLRDKELRQAYELIQTLATGTLDELQVEH
jgi:hypothetical protein